jgi:hypothetical protein
VGTPAAYGSLKSARVLVRFDHIARFIVNANHSVMWTAAMLRVADCVVDRIRFAVPQPIEWQRIGTQIDAATVPARSNLVSVLFLFHTEIGGRFRTLHF